MTSLSLVPTICVLRGIVEGSATEQTERSVYCNDFTELRQRKTDNLVERGRRETIKNCVQENNLILYVSEVETEGRE